MHLVSSDGVREPSQSDHGAWFSHHGAVHASWCVVLYHTSTSLHTEGKTFWCTLEERSWVLDCHASAKLHSAMQPCGGIPRFWMKESCIVIMQPTFFPIKTCIGYLLTFTVISFSIAPPVCIACLQLTSSQIDTALRDDMERLKKIRNHRGLRAYWGFKVGAPCYWCCGNALDSMNGCAYP